MEEAGENDELDTSSHYSFPLDYICYSLSRYWLTPENGGHGRQSIPGRMASRVYVVDGRVESDIGDALIR